MNKAFDMEIEGHRLAAVLAHSGNLDIPVFFLHGIGGSPYFWTPELTSPFHDLGPCYSLSLPGHFPAVFPKDFPAAGLTAELIARLVSGAIQRLVRDTRVLLVGHSTGGFAALSAAIYYPEVVAGVLSIAGFASGQWTGALGFNQWLVRQGSLGRSVFKMVYQLGRRNRLLFRLFWHVYVNDHAALSKHPGFEAVLDSSFPYIQKLDLDAMVRYFAVMPQTDISACLAEITAPVCLIAGDKDPIVPPGQSALIAGKVRGARLASIGGSGHLPFFERPVEYNQAVSDWLAEFRAHLLHNSPVS